MKIYEEIAHLLSLFKGSELNYLRVDLDEDRSRTLVLTQIDASISNGDRIYAWHKEWQNVIEYSKTDIEYHKIIDNDCR